MPYLIQKTKDILDREPGSAKGVGDYNYLFTRAMILCWSKAGNQRYQTIHDLKKASLQPSIVEEVMEVESILIVHGVLMEDRKVARELAFAEFYRRVGQFYENQKAVDNGDVYKGVPYALGHLKVATPAVEAIEPIQVPDVADHDADQEIGIMPHDNIKEDKSNGDNNRTQRKVKGR